MQVPGLAVVGVQGLLRPGLGEQRVDLAGRQAGVRRRDGRKGQAQPIGDPAELSCLLLRHLTGIRIARPECGCDGSRPLAAVRR